MVRKIEVDNHKLMLHPERVAEWRKTGDCAPIYIEIGPINRCNHQCVFCALDWLEQGKIDIDRDVMLKSLENMAEYGVKSIMFAGEGEPILHKDIGLFTQKAKQYGLDISITMNGSAFSKEKREQCLPYLSWARFSIDSGSPGNYSEVHRTNSRDFGRVIENIRESVKFRDDHNLEVTLGVQFLMIPQNLGEAGKLAEILRDTGVDNLQIKPYSHHPDSLNDLIVDSQSYNGLEDELKAFETEDFEIKFRRATAERIQEGITYPLCYGSSFFALADAKGNVIPCNLFYDDEKFTYGNLNENSFRDIWESQKRREVLERMREKGVEGCRKGCRLDADNRYLHRLENPQAHDNFI